MRFYDGLGFTGRETGMENPVTIEPGQCPCCGAEVIDTSHGMSADHEPTVRVEFACGGQVEGLVASVEAYCYCGEELEPETVH